MNRVVDKKYSILALIAFLILALHLYSKIFLKLSPLFSDLIIYSSLPLLLTIFFLPLKQKNLLYFLGYFGYFLGNILSALDNVFSIRVNPNISYVSYFIFYPLIEAQLVKNYNQKSITYLSGVLLTIAFPSLIVVIIQSNFSNNYLKQIGIYNSFNLIDDITLLLIALFYSIRKNSWNLLILFIGIAIFLTADSFSIFSNKDSLISDDLWLLALLIIALSLAENSRQIMHFNEIYTATIMLAISGCEFLLILLGVLKIQFQMMLLLSSTLIFPIFSFLLNLRHKEKEIVNLSQYQTDQLTGLATRRTLQLEGSKYLKESGAVFLIDLNEFKLINDNFGHAAGDQVLKEVASRFEQALSKNSLLVRLGGDEFLILNNDIDKPAHEFVQKIQSTLSYPIYLTDKNFSISASIGYLELKDLPDEVDISNISEILSLVDQTMYRAKKSELKYANWIEK